MYYQEQNLKTTISVILLLIGMILTSGCNVNNVNRSGLLDSADNLNNNLSKEAPGRYKIIGDKNEITLPFELYSGSKILINGEISGKKVRLLIDNGKLWDQIWFYNGEVDSINLRYLNVDTGSVSGYGVDGASDIMEGNNIDITFGEIQFMDQPSLISPPEAGFQKMFPGINGQVSSLLFKHFVVKFDFDNNIIVLTKPDKFRYTGKGQAIPMFKRENGSYCIPFSLQMADINVDNILIDIDLGTIFPLHIFENKKNNIRIPENSVKKMLGYGASGKIFGYQSRIKTVKIGKYSFNNVPTDFVAESANDSAIVETGTFGIPLMKRFNITFDYFNQIMYFESNKKFSNPFE